MNSTQPDPIFSSEDGVQRRTIVAGAAWTIPVIATAVGAPLAAASNNEPTLAFTNGPYTVAACGTLKDVVIKATTDGTNPPPANTPVTVTLPAGLTWSNGETGTRTVFTDANGEVVLNGLKGVLAGEQTMTASTTVTATAPVTVGANGQLWSGGSAVAGFPTGIEKLYINDGGYAVALYSNGELRQLGGGNPVIDTGVSTGNDAGVIINSGGGMFYLKDGALWSAGAPIAGFPTGIEKLYINGGGYAVALYSNGELRQLGGGNPLIDTGVSTGNDAGIIINSGGAMFYLKDSALWSAGAPVAGFPTGIEKLYINMGGYAVALYSNGELRQLGGGDPLIDTGVSTGNDAGVIINSGGAMFYLKDGALWSAGAPVAGFPTGIEKLYINGGGYAVALYSNGELRQLGGGNPVIDTGVSTGNDASVIINSGGAMFYLKDVTC